MTEPAVSANALEDLGRLLACSRRASVAGASRRVHKRAGSLAVAFVAALASSAGAAETWVEAKSPNFTVVSNAGESRARDTAWEFEQARAAFAKLWPWARLAQGRPVVVLVARDEATLSV